MTHKYEVVHCDLNLLQISFNFDNFEIKVPLMLHTKFSQIYHVVLEKKLILLG